MRPTRPLALLLSPLLALAACGPGPSDEQEPPDPSAVPLAGTFEVTSSFEVPATVAVPGPLGDALRLVHGLATDPGTALLDLAEVAGVPAVGELRLLLPDAVEVEVAGWMTEAIAAGGPSQLDELAELDALVRSVLLRFELRSTLSLPEGRHAPVALAFATPAGLAVIPVGLTAPVTAATGVEAALAWPGGGPAVVSISDHALGVPFGRYAAQGLEAALQARFGTADLAAVIGGLVDCPGVASAVAGRCLGPLCVGHRALVEEACRGGVGEAAARLEAQVLALDFKAIHLRAGAARPLGSPLPGAPEVTGLVGVWTAAIDLGNGAEPAAATFTAAR